MFTFLLIYFLSISFSQHWTHKNTVYNIKNRKKTSAMSSFRYIFLQKSAEKSVNTHFECFEDAVQVLHTISYCFFGEGFVFVVWKKATSRNKPLYISLLAVFSKSALFRLISSASLGLCKLRAVPDKGKQTLAICLQEFLN